MALGKLLNLGGMENKLPKTAQSTGRFRVARNVYPTPDGRIIPRYDFSEVAGQANNKRYITHITQYENDIITIVADDVALDFELQAYKNNTLIPQHYDGASGYSCLGGSRISDGLNTFDFSFVISSFRINNTLYFCNPYDSTLFKYDGVEISQMGCHQPIISCSQYASAGTRFIRVIQHCIDFDNGEPTSEYVQFPTNSTTTIDIRVDGQATNIIGNINVRPSEIIGRRIGSSSPYFYSNTAITYNGSTPGDEYFVVPSPPTPGVTLTTNITDPCQIGSYVIVQHEFTSTAITGFPEDCLGVALKVRSVSPLTLSARNVKYLSLTREWKTAINPLFNPAFPPTVKSGSRNFISVWGSTNADGPYVFRGMSQSFPFSDPFTPTTISFNFNVGSYVLPITPSSSRDISANYIFAITGVLELWYDIKTRKVSPNASYDFQGMKPDTGLVTQSFTGITNYQDTILFYTLNGLWYSDDTLGGFRDQLNLGYNTRIGEMEFGNVMSVAAASDFFVVSRERKNYFVNGSLSTGNIRTQELPAIEVGAWTNSASILVKDSIILITSIGVFSVSGGGNAQLLSTAIPKNFSTFDSFLNNDDVVFNLEGTNVFSDYNNQDLGLSVTYDEYRELLFIMKKGSFFSGNPILVFHTKTGEFYEWNGLVNESGFYASAIGSINGKLYIAKYDPTPNTLSAKLLVEDKTIPLLYPETYPIKLYSTWLTAEEPSLEKQLLQLKMFGYVYKNGSDQGLQVVHYKDWDINTKITNVNYIPLSTAQYGHKQRLNSDKVLAVSFGFEVQNAGVTFELESIEVEFNGIQQGMKK